MEVAVIISFVGLLVFLAHLFSGIFSKTRIPDVLMLILIGLYLGPVLKIVQPSHFGVVGSVFTTITLVIILFEGGLGLDISVLGKALRRTLTLTITCFLVSMTVVGLSAFFLTDLDLIRAFMLGAIVGGTSSAVVIPLVRQLKMQTDTSIILILESAITDVLCIVFALAFLEAHKLGQLQIGHISHIIGNIFSSFFLASVFGTLSGFLWSILLNRIRTYQNTIFTTPAFVFMIFGIVEILGYSGYISALAFGITIGNIESFKFPFLKKYIPHDPISLNETEKLFFSEVVFLLKTFFFVYVGLSIKIADLTLFYFGFAFTILIFILRIPIVRFSISKSTPKTDASLMAIIVPKGLAAAVLASIPLQQGVRGGEFIQNVTYAVVLFSIVLTSLLVFLLEKTMLSKVYNKMFSGFADFVENKVQTPEIKKLEPRRFE